MIEIARELVELCTAKGIKIAVAESCTGGMVSSAITDISGASRVFDCGFVTYSDSSKSEILKVCHQMIKENGTISEVVACEMVIGAIKHSNADIAISVTGIAGPAGATANKPVGLVHFATFAGDKVKSFTKQFTGDRAAIKLQATQFSLELLLELAKNLKE